MSVISWMVAVGAWAGEPAIRRHLERTVEDLRAAEVAHLSPEVAQRRAELLDVLEAYTRAGRYPHNHAGPSRERRDVGVDGAMPWHPLRVPVFIDQHGTPCAVAALLLADGQDALVELVAQHLPHVYVHDVGVLKTWGERVGFTWDELARIQPAYRSFFFNATYPHMAQEDSPSFVEIRPSIAAGVEPAVTLALRIRPRFVQWLSDSWRVNGVVEAEWTVDATRAPNLADVLDVPRLSLEGEVGGAQLRIGRVGTHWGRGSFVSPTDPVPEVLFLEPWTYRRGVSAVRAHVDVASPWGIEAWAGLDDALDAGRVTLRATYDRTSAEDHAALQVGYQSDTEAVVVGGVAEHRRTMAAWIEGQLSQGIRGDEPRGEALVGIGKRLDASESRSSPLPDQRLGGELELYHRSGPPDAVNPLAMPQTDGFGQSVLPAGTWGLLRAMLDTEFFLVRSDLAVPLLDGSGVWLPTVVLSPGRKAWWAGATGRLVLQPAGPGRIAIGEGPTADLTVWLRYSEPERRRRR